MELITLTAVFRLICVLAPLIGADSRPLSPAL